jgi:ParB-like chromosome segregation protein Spo0J
MIEMRHLQLALPLAGGEIKPDAESVLDQLTLLLAGMGVDDKIDFINQAKLRLHAASPFRAEPVDCVLWVKSGSVVSNDYNPNSVAAPEMELLKVSILEDGYTQPIVTFQTDTDRREVVDGFHRNRVGKECPEVRDRIHGYLPVVTINEARTDKSDRIAATIRHNRARGKHAVESMSDIVIELKKRNWSDAKICKNLGMDEDEVLRLCQVSGLTEVFSNAEFSKAWESEIFTDDEIATLEEGDLA